MGDKASERGVKMSVEYVRESKRMADFILARTHRGPGDTVEAAMHRAERLYGVPAAWLHRLRYREIKDMPMSAFAALAHAYRAASEAADKAYAAERKLADERGSKALWLADLVAGQKDEEEVNGRP
jgi:hypothetical protein